MFIINDKSYLIYIYIYIYTTIFSLFLSGHGVYYYADGDMYVGSWRNDERHGRGVMTYSKSDSDPVQEKYDGEFAEGKMSGRGCYWYY
jgi:hypothetical protein